ncbi:hypothetical protein Tco_0811183 [Tanacetum coccineum]
MSSPHKPLPKPSMVAKISIRPVWRKKLNSCNTSNVDDVNLPTQISKPQSPLNQPSKKNSPTTQTNYDSLQSHSLPLGNSYATNVGHPPITPQNFTQTLLTQPPLPHSLINPHVANMTHAQYPPSPHGDNQTQHPLPPSLRKEMLMNDITQLQELSNLLSMHLSQRNTPTSPYSPCLPHTLHLDQVENHVGYCPCCIFTQKQILTLSEDINWIEFLLTRPHPPLQVHRDYPLTTTSAPNSPPTTN